jgi:hypothetical protein
VTSFRGRQTSDSVRTFYDALHRPIQIRIQKNATIRRNNQYAYDPNGLWMVGWNEVSRDSLVFDATGWTSKVVTRFATDLNKPIVRQYLKDANSRLDSVHVTYPTGVASTGRKYVWNTSTGALTAARVQGLGPALTYDGRLIPQVRASHSDDCRILTLVVTIPSHFVRRPVNSVASSRRSTAR